MIKSFARLAALISASLSQSTNANAIENPKDTEKGDEGLFKTSVLNESVSDFLAQHRSHQSHRSHRSHRSSGGGSRPVPTYPTPAPEPRSDPRGQQAKEPGSVAPEIDEKKLEEALKDPEMRKNIIMRMQLTLQFEGLYEGPIHGVMDEKTRTGVLMYKKMHGIPGDAVLDAQTLNAFGVVGF